LDVSKIREDYPVLNRKINGKNIIYLDSACMSLKPKQVIERVNEYYNNFPSCSGRSVHKLATEATISMDDARVKMHTFLNSKQPNEIIFLLNATGGINLVANSFNFKANDRVLLTDREHNSNLVPWLQQEELRGIDVQVVPSKEDNTFDLEKFEEMMDKSVKLVSMVHTSNLDGTSIPAKEIIKLAHDHGALVMLDGAQSAPHKKIDVQELDVDFFVLSVHKMCGPTGVGVLYGKYDLLSSLKPYVVGGSTVKSSTYDEIEFLPPPEKFEAGLQNYAGIIGSGTAVEYLMDIGMDEIEEHDIKLNSIMTRELAGHPDIDMIGPKDPSLRGLVQQEHQSICIIMRKR
jgi:cysteine desulfurase/selenocysteine lyase